MRQAGPPFFFSTTGDYSFFKVVLMGEMLHEGERKLQAASFRLQGVYFEGIAALILVA